MSTERKARANRRNARASSGPKTTPGRVRSALNALRHGLSRPVNSDPVLGAAIEELASKMVEPGAGAEIQDLAHQVAEAQIDVQRARHARHRFLSDALNNPYYDSRANTRIKTALIGRFLQKNPPEMSMASLVKFLHSMPEGPCKFATILSQESKRLSALDRYERRALSRRKFAIRALDEARLRGSPQ
jgi:hypothetical protein